MPLPSVLNGALQCQALCKRTGIRCLNPCAFDSLKACRMHGSSKKRSYLTGIQHPNYIHGRETKEAKTNRSAGLARLRKIEEMLVESRLFKIGRSKGRKPNGY